MVSLTAVGVAALPLWHAPVLMSAAMAAIARSVDLPHAQVGPLVSTPAGSLPLGLATSAVRGYDVALLALAPALLGLPPGASVLSLMIAAGTWAALLSRR